MRNALTRLEVSARLVDARGLACPAPIIELARALKAATVVELWADDPAAGADLEAFCASTGHRLADVRGGPALQALVERRR